jgi:hypothetical protein
MPDSPKNIEEKLTRIIKAWQTHAKTASFAKKTLAEFTTAIQPSFDLRKRIAELESDLAAAINQRDEEDSKSLALTDKVVKAVIGDTDFGDDSTLYEALGYVRSSERQSGLTRKKAPPSK